MRRDAHGDHDWAVREARPGDGEGLARLHLETAREYVEMDQTRFRMPDADGLAAWFDDDLLSAGVDWACFVAIDGEHIIGEVEVRLVPPLDSARYQAVRALGAVRGYINSLAVSRTNRRQAVGQGLVRRAEQWLAAAGATAVELDTLASSPDSVPFYEAMGYRATKLIFERQLRRE